MKIIKQISPINRLVELQFRIFIFFSHFFHYCFFDTVQQQRVAIIVFLSKQIFASREESCHVKWRHEQVFVLYTLSCATIFVLFRIYLFLVFFSSLKKKVFDHTCFVILNKVSHTSDTKLVLLIGSCYYFVALSTDTISWYYFISL